MPGRRGDHRVGTLDEDHSAHEARRGDGATDPFYNPDPMAAPEAVAPTMPST